MADNTNKIYEEATAPFEVGKGSNYVIMVHGFTGSPYEMRELAEDLSQEGFHVMGIQLPGHTQTWKKLTDINWQDWWEEIKLSIETIETKNPKKIFIIGFSLGGALALYAGMHYPKSIDAIVLISTGILVKKVDSLFFSVIKTFFGIINCFKSIAPTIPLNSMYKDIQDQNSQNNFVFTETAKRYSKLSLSTGETVFEFLKKVREGLLGVTQPVLIFQGRKDKTIHPKSADYIIKRIQGKEKSLIWLENSGHVAMFDYERKYLFLGIKMYLKNHL